MKAEMPEFRRCCFCFPLRRGLLAWAYFKIIADAVLVLLMSYMFLNTVFTMITELIITITAATVLFMDFIVTIVFIVGGHKKNVQLIKVCYFLSMAMWVATFLLAGFTTALILYILFTSRIYHYSQIIYELIPVFFFLVTLTVQAYFLVLLKSEVIKLSNVGEFKFMNNAAVADCTMRCEKVIMAKEAMKTDN